jgi:hypothetical protein
MSDDKVETSSNTDVAATIDKQMVERDPKGVPAPAPAATPKALPWTARFHLPSIRFRAPKRA